MASSSFVLAFFVLLVVAVHAQTGTSGSSFGVSQRAASIRKSIPRFFDPTNGRIPINDTKNVEPYVKGIIVTAVPGIVFSVLSFIVMVFYYVCGCVCGACNTNKFKDGGYTPKERWVPFIILGFVLLIAISFMSVGFYYNDDFSRGISGDSVGVTSVISGLFDQVVQKLNELGGFVNGVASKFPTIATNVRSSFSNATSLIIDSNTLGQKFVQQAKYTSDVSVTVYDPQADAYVAYNCTFCASNSGQLNTISSSITAQTGDMSTTLNSTLEEVDAKLVTVQASIDAGLNSANTMLGDANTKIADFKGQFNDAVSTYVTPNDQIRWKATAGILVLPLIVSIIFIIGGFLKNGRAFNINVFVTWITAILVWLLFGLHLPFSVVLSDTCIFVDDNMWPLLNSSDTIPAKVVTACLTNTTLGNNEIFNITQQLDFANINFPNTFNVSSFDFSQLYSFQTTVNGLNRTVFGINDTAIDDGINQINSMNPAFYYGRNNVSLIDPANYPPPTQSAVNKTRLFLISAIAGEAQADQLLFDLRVNVSSLVNQTNSLLANLTVVQNKVSEIGASLAPIITDAKSFLAQQTCGFVGEAFFKTKAAFCDIVLGSSTTLSLSFFLIGLCTIPSLIFNFMMARRIPHPMDQTTDLVLNTIQSGSPR